MSHADPHLNYRELAEQLLLPYQDPSDPDRDPINRTIERYRKVLIDGLAGEPSEPKRIIVVGAGISGMLTAKLLHEFGHQVTVIEANKNRVGGRIKTFGQPGYDSPFKDKKQYAEAGAMRFPLGLHPLLKAYIEKYRLKTQEFYIADVDPDDPNEPKAKRFNAWLRCNSFQQRHSEYMADPKATNKRFCEGLHDDRTQTAAQLLDAAFDKARDYYSFIDRDSSTDPDISVDPEAPRRVNKPYEEWIEGWAHVIRDFDEHTLRRFLKEESELGEDTIDLIGTIENLSSRMPLSFIHSFLGRSDINTDNVYSELKGGSWQLTEALCKDLEDAGVAVKLDRRMTHIDFCHDDGTRGGYASPQDPISIRTVSEDEQFAEIITGDLAVITIPFSSLRFVRTDPDFTYGKRRAIIELHYDAATKVVLEFSKRWWEWEGDRWQKELTLLNQQGDISDEKLEECLEELEAKPPTHAIGGGSITDNPNRFMYYPSHPVEGSAGGVILASYTWADDARRWDSMDDAARFKFALRGLRIIHGWRIELFYSCGATQSWARSPYAFGEAAVFNAGQLSTLHPHIPTPEGPVHFAGEHTSLKHAWIEGSLESAIRVALEVKEVTSLSD